MAFETEGPHLKNWTLPVGCPRALPLTVAVSEMVPSAPSTTEPVMAAVV